MATIATTSTATDCPARQRRPRSASRNDSTARTPLDSDPHPVTSDGGRMPPAWS